MLGAYSFFVSIGIFAGIFDLLILSLFYKLLRPYLNQLALLILISLLLTPLEFFALRWHAWQYDWTKNIGVHIIDSPIETYFFSLFCAIAIGSTTFIWSFYLDKKKKILFNWLRDMYKARYAFWRK